MLNIEDSQTNLWHKRYGNLHFHAVDKVIKNCMVQGSQLNP